MFNSRDFLRVEYYTIITPNIYFAQVTMTLQLEQMKLLCPILYSVHVFYACFSQVLFLLFFFFSRFFGGWGVTWTK